MVNMQADTFEHVTLTKHKHKHKPNIYVWEEIKDKNESQWVVEKPKFGDVESSQPWLS